MFMAQKILRDYRSLWEAWDGEDKAEEVGVIIEYLETLSEELEYGLVDINEEANMPLMELLTTCNVHLEAVKEMLEDN